MARLQEAMGATIWRADYFGDVGLHVAKAVWGIERKMEEDKLSLDDLAKRSLNDRVELMGQGYALGVRSYEEDDSAKEEIERLNTVIYIVAQKLWQEKGKTAIVDYDPKHQIRGSEIDEIYELYKTCREWSMDYFETIYRRLGTKFNGYYPESLVGEIGYKYVADNIGKVFQRSEGAVIFPGEKYGLHTRVFINKHNLPTYEAKELGLAPAKYSDFTYDRSIIVVGKELVEYFPVLIEAMKRIEPKLGNVTKAIYTGMVRLSEGKMSSRTGNVVTVLSLLEIINERCFRKNEKR